MTLTYLSHMIFAYKYLPDSTVHVMVILRYSFLLYLWKQYNKQAMRAKKSNVTPSVSNTWTTLNHGFRKTPEMWKMHFCVYKVYLDFTMKRVIVKIVEFYPEVYAFIF